MTPLRLAQVVPDTEAEGPGRRYALWVQGCSLRCPGCCNPEMFGPQGGRLVEPDALAAEALAMPGLEGVSLLGGEPTEQAEPLARFAAAVRQGGLSVMLYSGHTLAELRAKADPHVEALLAATDLLVDGRYEQRQPEKSRRWLGSSNQVLHFLTDRYREDDPRFSTPNTVELRLDAKGNLLLNGWPAAADALRRRR